MISGFSIGAWGTMGALESLGMTGALTRDMNAITFGTKRAFQGFVRATRKPLAGLGLTAARFDLLSVLLHSVHRW